MITILKPENLCSIFHAKFKQLRSIVPNVRQAQLLDYILLGWQGSTYKLKNSDKTWFMKPYNIMSQDTGISLSTLKRYLKDFEDADLIERQQHLFSRTTEYGFEVKKGCYIRITDKLIKLLNSEAESINISTIETEKTNANIHINDTKEDEFRANSENFNKIETIEKLNLSRSYIRDLYTSISNNISSSSFVKNADKNFIDRNTSVLNSIKICLYQEIKEEIPNEIKDFVFGTFVNLIVKNKVILSSPKQVVAEYIFALLNNKFFLKNIDCIKHRNNILAKLLIDKRWKTPKGFYKHFYLGENFKEKNKIREEHWCFEKESEIKAAFDIMNSGYLTSSMKNPRLVEMEARMSAISETIYNLKDSLCSISDTEERINVRNTIEELTNELHQLWEQQKNMEEGFLQQHNLETKGVA